MDQKPVKEASIYGGGGIRGESMKRSPSELVMDELFSKDEKVGGEIRTQRARIFAATGDLPFPLSNRDIMSGFPSCGQLPDGLLWSQNVSSKQSSVSATIDSQSSICVGSPNSATIPKGRDDQPTGVTSGSSHEQSDDDDMETEAGPCEQSNDAIDVKRIKRMVSNRESARRSRRRKQAHLAELEQQVDELRGENASLFKKLTDATQQFRDATTNNRVLKSDVEALRAKVKLAEDMVTRGSVTSGLGNRLPTHLTTPQSFSNHVSQLGNVSSTITVAGDDVSYSGMTGSGQHSALGLENADTFNGGGLENGVIGDAVSSVSDNWPWDSHVPTISK